MNFLKVNIQLDVIEKLLPVRLTLRDITLVSAGFAIFTSMIQNTKSVQQVSTSYNFSLTLEVYVKCVYVGVCLGVYVHLCVGMLESIICM